MKSPKEHGYTEEFALFQAAPSVPPSSELSSCICQRVAQDLNPSLGAVFKKVFAIHVVTALLTLSVCPQFGFKLGADGMGLMHWFMPLGEVGCRMACGFFFMVLSLGLSAALLNAAEVQQLRRKWWLESLFLILVSLGFFLMIAREDVLFFLALGWTLGGMLGGWVGLNVVWKLRVSSAYS